MKQTYFNFDNGNIEEVIIPPKAKPADSVLFMHYLKQVAPVLCMCNGVPFHKTSSGYATNNSPWTSDEGSYEFYPEQHLIVHKKKSIDFVANNYEVTIKDVEHRVEFTEDRMKVY